MLQNIIHALSQPQQNGIVTFISGFLIALGLYHLLLYLQNKNKAYLYYALYALLVFIYTYHRASHFIFADMFPAVKSYIIFLYDPIKWAYSLIYMLFAITFVDLKKYYPRFYNFLIIFIKYSFVILAILTLWAVIQKDNAVLKLAYNFIFLPVIFVLSLYILYKIYKTNSPVKYYLLIGAGVYLLITSYSHYLTYSGQPFRVLFYAAISFELILFALGLGYQQKLILDEKNLWHKFITKEYEKNLKLKDSETEKLGEEVYHKSAQINTLILEKKMAEQKKLAIAYSKQILQLRMQAVQAQMNPHFLFNALNSIKNFIIKNDQKQAVIYLTKFAKLIRMILENAKLPEISLKDELDLMRLYVEVENIRFNKEIDFSIEICPSVDINKTKVPPMIFQALIENAIWHGLAPKKGYRKLLIKICAASPYIKIIIEDNGIGREKAKKISALKNVNLKKESMGIKITKERLEVFTQAFKNKFKIEYIDLYNDEKFPQGTRINIFIPTNF